MLASLAGAALRCAVNLVAAQTAASGAPLIPAARAGDEAIVLSPFTVNTDKDVGFVAASSLAGGRLASDLKDTPAAYSVLTREFIDALQLTELAQAADWSVNTTQTQDNGSIEVFGGLAGFKVRGAEITRQRNFFPFPVNFDSYNLERFDFGRGPNAILFGAGSIGGTANVVTKQAMLNRTSRQSSRGTPAAR